MAAKTTNKKPSKKASADPSAKGQGVKSRAAKTTPETSKPATTPRRAAKTAARPATKKSAPSKNHRAAPSEEAKSAPSSKSTTKSQTASEIAHRILSGEGGKTVNSLGDELVSGKKSVATQAARVLDEILDRKPEAVIPIIDRFAKIIGGPAKRPAQAAARALPVMARVAPARVAKHLPRLKESFGGATEPGKDGLIRTFAGLCTASVAYQKRLEDVLNQGLREADAKTLISWTEVVLPALKGEPHARARATVEARLDRIPRIHAQKIADFLGIKLRLRYR